MKFNKSLKEAVSNINGQQPQTVDNNDLSDPVIAQLTQKKIMLQQQMQKQIAAIDVQIAKRQQMNNVKKPVTTNSNVPGIA